MAELSVLSGAASAFASARSALRRGTARVLGSAALVAAMTSGLGTSVWALDPQSIAAAPDAAPSEMFHQGFTAYKRGEKLRAVEALRFAAEKGHPGARWKLGRMYADGDGVPEDDYEAFKIFQEIVNDEQDDTTVSPNAAYVADSMTTLADYLRLGIPNTPVRIDLSQARQLYFNAASVFGDPRAQYHLGRMLLNGEGGRANPPQAARWLNLSAGKGDPRAQALLGHLLFDGEQIAVRAEPARGLALMTLALRNASVKDEPWIRAMQEEAFSLASERDRRTAAVFADAYPQTVARN